MAHQNNDDVARALAALAGGAVPSEHETPSSGIPSESTVFDNEPAALPPVTKSTSSAPLFSPHAVPPVASAPLRSATVRPVAAAATPASRQPPKSASPAIQPARVTPAAPVTPAQPTRARAPSPAPAPVVPPIPAMPELPQVAKIRPATNSKRPAAPSRPLAPSAAPPIPPPQMPAAVSITEVPADDILSEITEEEDDEVIAPAPDLSAFAPKVRTAVARKHLYEQTSFRRTIIPILLTGGVLMIALGAWSHLDRDGILGNLGGGIDILFISLGTVLIGVGVLNMLHVKHILDATPT